jgi:hypothetical protein
LGAHLAVEYKIMITMHCWKDDRETPDTESDVWQQADTWPEPTTEKPS